MPKRGKNYKAAVAAYNKAETFEAKDALKIAVDNAKAKFEETVEVHIKLGVQMVQEKHKKY